MRSLRWIFVAGAAALLAVGVGCGGEIQATAKVETKPPPPPDADGDGILDDGTDKCVGEKEDGLPPDPKDGCKSSDPDGDGITGDADKCPNEPETKNEYQDEDGCADTVPKVAVIGNEVRIKDKIMFAFGSAKIDKASDDLLENIAKVVKENPQIEFMEVAGHADKVGNDAGNVLLTKQRAESVVAALATRGVDKKRMRGVGYGRYCELDPGDSEESKEKNRRVEFKIMRIDGKDTNVKTGCDAATEKGIKPQPVPATAPKKADLEKAAGVAPAAGDKAATPAAAGTPAAKPEGTKPEAPKK